MFSGAIAGHLRAEGHDVLAVVADPALIALPDEQILAHASAILDQPTQLTAWPGHLPGAAISGHAATDL
jgi:hypothetical protein